MRKVNFSAGPKLTKGQKASSGRRNMLFFLHLSPEHSPNIPHNRDGTGLSKGLLPPGEKNSHLSESYHIPGSTLGSLIDIISWHPKQVSIYHAWGGNGETKITKLIPGTQLNPGAKFQLSLTPVLFSLCLQSSGKLFVLRDPELLHTIYQTPS